MKKLSLLSLLSTFLSLKFLHRFKINLVLAIFFLFTSPSVFSANIFNTENSIFLVQNEITGIVTDSKGMPLPGVSVIVSGESNGTTTDFDGNFSIDAVEGDILEFSYVGMETQRIEVGNESNINVTLAEDLAALDEVVLVGYGSMQKEKLVTPVSSVDTELIQSDISNSVDRALEGKIAGLSVKQGSGAPGGGSELQIRGATSIGAGSQPLVVIDGVPVQASYSQERSVLSMINSADINSINVLKGAAATAIYGSRGSNGVILVETKRGKEGRTTFSFSANTGWDKILPSEKLDVMNAEEFARWRKENAYESAAFYGEDITDADIPEVYRNPESLGEGTDWQDVLSQVGQRQEYNLSISHGANDFTGYFSMGYLDQTGTVKNTDFERLTFRANMGYEPNEIVKIELNINPTLRTWNNQVGGNRASAYGQGLINTPVDGPYREDGSWERDNAAYYDGKWDLDIWSPGTFSANNSLYALEHQYDKTQNFNLLVTPAIEIKPIEGLTLRTHYNARLEYNLREYFQPSTITGIFNPPPGIANGYYNTDRNYSWQWENTANYSIDLGDHSFTALIGASLEHYNMSYNRLNGSEYARDDIRTINAATEQTGSSGESNWSMESYFARANYDFKSKYLLTASVRRDGSSRFGPDRRWATFPSLAAGWVISKEDFFPESNWLSSLKFRGGYGKSGNNSIGNYTWIPTVDTENYSFGGRVANGLRVSAIENTALGWETATEYSAGLDFLFWDGRVSLDIDYFDRNTEDMLWAVAVPVSSGYGSIQDNIGEINVKGWEFALGSNNINTPNFTWNTDFNISFNKNEVKNLGEVDRIFAGPHNVSITRPGQPIAMFYGLEQIGIFRDEDEVANSASFPGQLPGTVKFRDVDGNGVINDNDRKIIGDPHPTFRGGLINTFSYNNFDLSIAMSFAHDFDVYAFLEEDVLNLDGVFNVLKVAEQRWRSPENPGNGEIPTSIHQTDYARRASSKMLSSDISFLKAQNITLGYSFQDLKFLNSFRLYASVQNAFLLTNYKYGNPDINSYGANPLTRNIDQYDYPLSRTIAVGLDINF